jgi:hypothetical protein
LIAFQCSSIPDPPTLDITVKLAIPIVGISFAFNSRLAVHRRVLDVLKSIVRACDAIGVSL